MGCLENGYCDWSAPGTQCPDDFPHPCYDDNGNLFRCESTPERCYDDGSGPGGPQDCTFNSNACDEAIGEVCTAEEDTEGERSFCLVLCDFDEPEACGEGLMSL